MSDWPDSFERENNMRNAACKANAEIIDLNLKLQQIKNLCNPGSHKAECKCVTCLIIEIIERKEQ